MQIEMIQAKREDVEIVSSILQEVADWLIQKGEKLWERNELSADKLSEQVENGMFWLAKGGEEFAGCIRYQNEDLEYWNDVPHSDSAFVHRVAVCRKFAGQSISKEMIEWAKRKAKSEGKRFLRLDCANRKKLRNVYENVGFKFHSFKERDPYLVVRYEFDLSEV
jgi:GNAT superfamily N-acetyltransferase